MMSVGLEKMTESQLLRKYAEIGVQQDEALLDDSTVMFSKLYRQKRAVEQELKSRPGDQRRLLRKLYDHPNMQVRLNAAKATLAVAPVDAKRQLEEIKSSRHFPQAADAGMSLWNLERGVFRPE